MLVTLSEVNLGEIFINKRPSVIFFRNLPYEKERVEPNFGGMGSKERKWHLSVVFLDSVLF